MLFAKTFSAALHGVAAQIVEIETNIAPLPEDAPLDAPSSTVAIVGLPDTAVRESRDRVMTAITNSAFSKPKGNITINLAPADIRKVGPSFDLPIAVSLLLAAGAVKLPESASDKPFALLGELALDGKVRPVKGALSVAIALRGAGVKKLLIATENSAEVSVIEGIDVIPVGSLLEAVNYLSGKVPILPKRTQFSELLAKENAAHHDDFAEVRGQEAAKRAIEVAVAGGHNILMIGPPGTGKTMLAQRIATILPPMTFEESLETSQIYSVHGNLSAETPLILKRPFRRTHHAASGAGLLGGGTNPRPGEVSLAHNGILFLDELAEFPRAILDQLRQPLEDGKVTISRASGTVTYPSRFVLVAAMNPCKCGHYGDPLRACKCSRSDILRYRGHISGPLIDRIDLHIQVPAVPYKDINDRSATGTTSAEMRARVLAARNIQRERFRGISTPARPIFCNSAMGPREVREFCVLEKDADILLQNAMISYGLSARAYDRILKVARTIADLANSEKITSAHVAEAIQYRSLDREP